MLNNSQIEYLTSLCELNVSKYGNIIISAYTKNKSKTIRCKYEDFKNALGLDDIRFHWMLTDKAYLAGGCCLNWIWGENKNEDIDFFFAHKTHAENFKNLIKNYGFEETCESKYALTFFNREEKIILQIIGGEGKGNKDEKFNGFIPYGTPEETIQ